MRTNLFFPWEVWEMYLSVIKINTRRRRIEARFIYTPPPPPFVHAEIDLIWLRCLRRGVSIKKEKKKSILTVAAPLTCTDLLAVDRVPGTRSTDSCTSFGFTSTTFTSLKKKKPPTGDNVKQNGRKEDSQRRSSILLTGEREMSTPRRATDAKRDAQ